MAKRKTGAADVAATAVETTAITSIKGFDKNLQCKGFQFEAGKTFTHEGDVAACHGGFHACPVEHHPLSVFEFYGPAGSRYCEVTQSGATHAKDTKLASATITIGIELSLGDLVKRAWDYVWSRATLEPGTQATGYQGAASATGNRGAASATGNQGAASATGNRGAASATGELGAASATGYQGAASATGKYSAATASGFNGKAQAVEGSAIFLVERIDDFGPDHGKIAHVWAGIAGLDGIKPGVFYTLRGGQPVEVL